MLPDLSALVVTGSPACGTNEEKKSQLTVFHFSNTHPKTRRALWACRTDNQTCRDTYFARASHGCGQPSKFVEVTLSPCPNLLHLRNDHEVIGKLFDQYKAAILKNDQYVDMIKGIFLPDDVLEYFNDWPEAPLSDFLIIEEYKPISQDDYVASTYSEYVARDTNPYLKIILRSGDKIDIRTVTPNQDEKYRPDFQVGSKVEITESQDGLFVFSPHTLSATVLQHPGAFFKFDATTGRVLFKHGTNGGDVYGAFNVRLRAQSQLHVPAADQKGEDRSPLFATLGAGSLVWDKRDDADFDISNCILREDDDGGQDLAIIHFMSWVATNHKYEGVFWRCFHFHTHCVFT